MSDATQRNFGAAQRERNRRLGLSLRGELPIGLSTVSGEPGWDAFFGSLHDKEEEAAAQGMGFRASLGDIGRFDAPSGMAQPSNAGNVGLGRLTDANAVRHLALKRAVDQERDAAIADAQDAYDTHVLNSVGQPREEGSITTESVSPDGKRSFSIAPSGPDTRSARQRMLDRLPGALRAAMDPGISALEQRDRAQTEAERHNAELERIARETRGQKKPLTATSESNLIQKLATDWTKANTQNEEIERQYKIMKTGLDRYDADPNGASQAVLITFQKMLDPDSVVRESEYDRSAQGLSLKARIEGYVERLARGGAGVPKSELAEMVKTAEEFRKNTQDAPERKRKRLESVADRYELPYETVFGAPKEAKPETGTGGSKPKSGSRDFRKDYDY